MICKNCGSTLEENALFCGSCGMPQDYLIKQVISGDQHAFELLYNYSYQSVYWTIHSMVNLDEDTIYDIMQDSYLRAFRALPQLKESTAFNGWMKRIAQNETLDYLRKTSKNNTIFFSDMTSDDSDVEEYDVKDESVKTNPEASMEYQDRSRLLNEILDAIPEEQRVVLSMYYMQEMSIKEIAEELGISENTVKSRMSYGRKKVEKSVLDLEKKGVSLLGLTAMGFFTWLLTGITSDAAAAIPETVLQEIEQGLQNITSSASTLEGAATGTQASEKAESMAKMTAKEVGKRAARDAGKAGITKIIVGVIGIIVVGIVTGIVINNVNNRNSNSESEQAEVVYETEAQSLKTVIITEEAESESETEAKPETEAIFETETKVKPVAEFETEPETEFETKAEPETEIKTESETERIVSLTSDDMILDTIRALGYEYIGGQFYDVIYQGGYAYTDNAGMEQEPPVGVASYALADLDGDGEEELLLVILEPTERIYDTSGKQDSRLTFTVCENRDGSWEISQSISQVSDFHDGDPVNITTIADLLPCISTYLVPSGDGMHIVIDNPVYGSFSADNFFETIEIIYTEDSMTGVVYGAWSDRIDGENEAILALEDGMQSAGSVMISKIYLPDFYNDAGELNWDEFTYLQMGQDVTTTLVIDDFKDLNAIETNDNEGNPAEDESGQADTEYTGDRRFEENGLLIIYKDEEQAGRESPDISEEARAAYQVILDEYIAASNDNNFTTGYYVSDDNPFPDVSAVIMSYYHLISPNMSFYYTFYDIDGNGQTEMIIGSADEEYMEYLSLVDVYTFDGEKALKFSDNTYSLGDRSQLYVYKNGAIIIHDSLGAVNGDYRFMTIEENGYTVTLDKEYIYYPYEEEFFVYSCDSETLSGEEFGAFYSEYIEEDIDIENQLNENGYFGTVDLEGLNFDNWIKFIDSMNGKNAE